MSYQFFLSVTCCKVFFFHRELYFPSSVENVALSLCSELKGYHFHADTEDTRSSRRVRVGLIQNHIVLPTTETIDAQRDAIMGRVGDLIGLAALCGVNVVCMQEAWS